MPANRRPMNSARAGAGVVAASARADHQPRATAGHADDAAEQRHGEHVGLGVQRHLGGDVGETEGEAAIRRARSRQGRSRRLMGAVWGSLKEPRRHPWTCSTLRDCKRACALLSNRRRAVDFIIAAWAALIHGEGEPWQGPPIAAPKARSSMRCATRREVQGHPDLQARARRGPAQEGHVGRQEARRRLRRSRSHTKSGALAPSRVYQSLAS